jgi:EmrB/QacA subfamily drug resistance transporter
MGSTHLGCTQVPSGGEFGAVISPSEREMAHAARLLTAARPSETVAATPPALALGVILSAQLLVVLNVSIVNVALPSIQGDLDLSAIATQWLVTAYTMSFGGLLIVGGRAGDLLGRRRLFLSGLTFFSIASLVGATSRSAGMLVATRAVQGVGAAVIAPTALALLATTFPEGAARNRAIGMYGATASVGFVAGLLVGGVLVSGIGWRAVFWVNVPIGIAAAMLGWTSLPADRRERRRGVPDVVGAVLLTLATATIAYIPVAGSTDGWHSIRFIGGASLAAILLVVYALWELSHGNSLMHLGTPRLPTLGAANVVTLLFGAWNAGEVLIIALYRQRILGYSALGAGLASLPQALAGLIAGLLGAWLADRFGNRILLLATTAMSAIGQGVLAAVIGSGDHFLTGAALFAVGFGTGGTAFAATVAGCGCVAELEQGFVGGLINSSRQIGAALGVAALVDVATSVTALHLPDETALAMGYRAAIVFAAGLATAAFFVSVAFIPSDRPLRPPTRVPRSGTPE